MRLFFIIENNEPHASGGGYYAPLKFAEFLALKSHFVYVYSVNDLGLVRSLPNLKVYFRPKISRKNRYSRKADKTISDFHDIFVIRRLIKGFNPDWSFGVLKESAIKASRYGKEFGIFVANFVYECPPMARNIIGAERFEKEYRGYTKELWEKTREAYLASDILFPNSELTGAFNSEWLDRKPVSEPIYPGVDTDQMPYVEPDRETTAGQRKVLYVGRLEWNKNVDLLIRAFRELRTPARLDICGDGPERERLTAMVGDDDRIALHGFISDEALWAHYSSWDFVVFPSVFEGFGMPPMQALYFGKPCIVSDIPVFRSTYGDYLEYVPPNDLVALTEAMEMLFSNMEYRLRRGREGRSFILSNFSWSLSAQKIEKALLQYMGTVPSRIDG